MRNAAKSQTNRTTSSSQGSRTAGVFGAPGPISGQGSSAISRGRQADNRGRAGSSRLDLGQTEVTREAVEILAMQEGMTPLACITLLQAGAARMNDGERTLDALCVIKREIIADNKTGK